MSGRRCNTGAGADDGALGGGDVTGGASVGMTGFSAGFPGFTLAETAFFTGFFTIFRVVFDDSGFRAAFFTASGGEETVFPPVFFRTADFAGFFADDFTAAAGFFAVLAAALPDAALIGFFSVLTAALGAVFDAVFFEDAAGAAFFDAGRARSFVMFPPVSPNIYA